MQEQYNFDSVERLCEFLERHERGLPSEVYRSLTGIFENAHTHKHETAGPFDGMQVLLPRISWAIRNDDLQFLANFFDAVKAGGASGLLFTDSPPVGGMVAFSVACIVSTAKTLRQAWMNGAELDRLQIRLLITIKSLATDAQGVHTLEICESLSEVYPDSSWAISEIEEELKKMTQVATRNGLVSFVTRDANGAWLGNGY